jgi:hypothetical protein
MGEMTTVYEMLVGKYKGTEIILKYILHDMKVWMDSAGSGYNPVASSVKGGVG